ncbi:MAG TPA: hydrogenase maturation nickel metallochaperone HypA [Gemmatimonadales bacterium]|nr:hydrogenase maturation nickel metallochaperone HypA [Gemmatimonadales bacterium]
MHEVSLAGGILKLVEDAARRERFRRVTRLTLEVGRLSGVEVESLRFALDAMAPGTLLEGAAVVIEEPPGTALCMDCSELTQITERGEACRQCGGLRLQPTGGTALRVLDLVVEDD